MVYMARHPHKVFTHATPLNAGWGEQDVRPVEYLWVFVNQLRKKIEPEGLPHYRVTEPRIGYRFRPDKA